MPLAAGRHAELVIVEAENQQNGRGLDLLLAGDFVQFLLDCLVRHGDDRELLAVVAGRRVADRRVDQVELFPLDGLPLVPPDRPAPEQRVFDAFHKYGSFVVFVPEDTYFSEASSNSCFIFSGPSNPVR